MPLHATGEAYRGMNIVLLWVQSMMKGYASPMWMTYRQARELGGHVREGESGSVVVYTNTRKVTEGADGEEQDCNVRIPECESASKYGHMAWHRARQWRRRRQLWAGIWSRWISG